MMARPATLHPTILPAARTHGDWITDFIDYTEGTASPIALRRWTAIYTIASALERCTWTVTSRGRIFPNLFVFLVAPAGIGKTLILNLGRQQLMDVGEGANRPQLSPTNMSQSSLADALAAAERKIDRFQVDPINPFIKFNSLSIISPELGNLLPEYDNRMMNFLTDLYDCGAYIEHKRGNSLRIEIPDAQLNLLGACTPSYLNSTIPPAAWDQGFMSRVVLAYSGESVFREMFDETQRVSIPDSLAKDLGTIFSLYGEFGKSDDYKACFHEWQRGGYEPLPTHPRLQAYCQRRPTMVLKLSMIAAVSEANTLVLEPEHFTRALGWLTEAETFMPEIFKASGLGGDSALMDEAFHHLFTIYMKGSAKPVAESVLVEFLRVRTAAHLISRVIEIMQRSNMIEKVSVPNAGARTFYKPLPVTAHQQ